MAESKNDPWKTLIHSHMTEKSITEIEAANGLVFMVNRKSGKEDIKEAFETAFGEKVDSIQTLVDRKGKKKAFIKLKEDGKALDVATRLGMM